VIAPAETAGRTRDLRPTMRSLVPLPIAAVLTLLAEAAADAQPASSRIDVGVGVRWLGDTSFERVTASQTAPANARLTLFDTDTTLDAAATLDARVGVRLSSIFQVEAALSYGHPTLRARITSDVEGISDVTVSESTTQYIVEGGITAQLSRWQVGRLKPFASAGGGFLRQLHEGRQLAENGRTFYVGGGVRYPLTMRQIGLVKGAGIRADVRAAFWRDGIALDEDIHAVPSLSASLFVSF
jgi:hypothetical protein